MATKQSDITNPLDENTISVEAAPRSVPMQCIICNNSMAPYFTKQFNAYGLGEVEYCRCRACGFVASKTHSYLSDSNWKELNKAFHSSYHETDICPEDRNWVQRINTQADVIADLAGLGILPIESLWLDYACGDGKLSDILLRKYKLNLQKFDRYENKDAYLADSELLWKHFGFVITTSVFEHLRNRKSLDEIESLVAHNGIMGIHTLVAEEIPASAEWFYLLPVHCAFYTNKSMQLLFDQWGYSASIYHVESRLWFWFKTDAERVGEIIAKANAQPGREMFTYHFKRGFMDYWKLEPDKIIKRPDNS